MQIYNFGCGSVGLWNLDIKGGTQIEDVWEQGAEENTCHCQEYSHIPVLWEIQEGIYAVGCLTEVMNSHVIASMLNTRNEEVTSGTRRTISRNDEWWRNYFSMHHLKEEQEAQAWRVVKDNTNGSPQLRGGVFPKELFKLPGHILPSRWQSESINLALGTVYQ
jgi:hypothetical protein